LFCIVMLVLSYFFSLAGAMSEGLIQPALAASRVEWIGVFILACVCISQRRGFEYLLAVTLFEMLKGFSGFFAGFKEVFFVVLVAVFATRSKLNLGGVVVGLVVGGVLLGLAVFWSAVKVDYREYAGLGTGQQAVLISTEDRFRYLFNRAYDADLELMSSGFESLVQRLGYIEMLAATMDHVPDLIPFQEGAQVGATIMHVLQPRLLFPDKPPLPSDTAAAVRYTGIAFDAGNNAVNTSISLGYFAELYVDFGYAGIIIGSFLFGLLFGYCVKRVSSYRSLPLIMNFGLSVMLMLSFASFEMTLVKMVGGFLTTLSVIVGLQKFVLPYLLRKFRWMRLSTGAGASPGGRAPVDAIAKLS
jgi:hypothetical protein